jgi:hypothetical protein
LALIIGLFFVPYSPRWRESCPRFAEELWTDYYLVVMRGRHEEARVVLKRLHDDNEDHAFWEKEYIVLVAQLEMERRETEGVHWWHMFTNRRELHRAMLSVVALTSTQTNGAQTIQVFQVRQPSFRLSAAFL